MASRFVSKGLGSCRRLLAGFFDLLAVAICSRLSLRTSIFSAVFVLVARLVFRFELDEFFALAADGLSSSRFIN